MDYFDTDEIRRRRMLEMQGGTIEGVDPGDMLASQALAPDEEDLAGEDVPSGPVSGTPAPTKSGMGAAQQRYANVLQQAPERPHIGIGRRILAGIAGAGGGPQAAYGVLDRPYQKAMSGWQTQVQAAGMGAGLEEKVMAQDIAQQRANAYGRSADARMRAASATDAWRQYQQAHMPWQPTNKEEYMDAERAKHPGATPKPGDFEHFMQDPAAFQRFMQSKNSGKQSTSLTYDQRLGLVDATARARAKYRAPKDPKQVVPATPRSQEDAEDFAVEQLIRQKPEYASFVNQVKDKNNNVVRHTIKSANEIPQAGGGFLGFGSVSPSHASMARDQYRLFLQEVEKKKREMLGSKAPGGGAAGDWEQVQ